MFLLAFTSADIILSVISCTHCSCTIFVLISCHTSHANFDFNWYSVSTECCFWFGKSSNCQDHCSGSHHPVKKFTPRTPPPLTTIWKTPYSALGIRPKLVWMLLIIVVMLVIAQKAVNIQEIIYCTIKLGDFGRRKFKGTVKWWTKWRWSNFSDLTISEFINHYKVTFSKFFDLPSSSKTCALPFDFALERDLKNISCYHCDVESYTDQVLNFYITS